MNELNKIISDKINELKKTLPEFNIREAFKLTTKIKSCIHRKTQAALPGKHMVSS